MHSPLPSLQVVSRIGCAALLVSLALFVDGPRTARAVAPSEPREGAPNHAPPRALVSAEETILAPGTAGGASVGWAVSLSADGSRALIGAPNTATSAGLGAGLAYVYRRTGTTWALEATLSPAAAAAHDAFGSSVSLSADGLVALVGAPTETPRTGNGWAWVFELSGGRWRERGQLRAIGSTDGDRFGVSVALSGDGTHAVVGAPEGDLPSNRDVGTASVFERVGTTWVPRTLLSAAGAARSDGFGASVAMNFDGSTAIVGAPGDDTPVAANAGTVRVFSRAMTTWTETAMLSLGGSSGPAEFFGGAVALSGDGSRALIGGLGSEAYGPVNTGAAWVFAAGGSGWALETLLPATGLSSGDAFGNALSLNADGTRALVGSYRDNGDEGSARLFERTTRWVESGMLAPSAIVVRDYFANSVALSADGTRAIAGATSDAIPAGTARAGTARVFSVTSTLANGAACGATDTCASGFCVDGVCCNTACVGGSADCRACSVAAGAPADGVCAPRVNGTTCRDAAGVCDVPETCNGTAIACPADALSPNTMSCRPGMGSCDPAEFCSGTSAACPPDRVEADGTSCADGARCNGDEVCRAGVCEVGTALMCDDGDPCTTDGCSEPLGCAHVTSCMDAGSDVDAGSDAGVMNDASVVADASVMEDANTMLRDAGVQGDGGASDAAALDARSADPGSDAGPPPVQSPGCSCSASQRTQPALAAVLGLALALVLRARRRRP